MLRIVTVAALALTLGGCAVTEIFDKFGDASSIIAQGQKIQKEAAEKLAIGFDGYCNTVPSPARSFVRKEVNAALADMTSKWRASDFCKPAGP